MQTSLRFLLLSPLLCLLLTNYAAAQQAVAAAPVVDGPVHKVEVKASAYDARREDTATKIVVTQEEILKNGDTTIGDVLKRLPGITIGGVQGRGGAISMRGLGSGYTQILLNGEPSPPGFSLDTLAPDMIERIEIMRAATAEYSTQAIAGTINIVLKRAIVTAQRELKVGLQSDNRQPGANTNFQVSDKVGIYSYAVGGGVTYGRQHWPSSDSTTILDPNGVETTRRETANDSRGNFKALNLAPRVNINLGPNDVLTSQSFVSASQWRGVNTGDTDTRFGTLPQFSSSSQDVGQTNEALRTDLSWTHKMAGGAKLDAKAGINYAHRETTIDYHNFYPGAVLALTRNIDSYASDRGVTASGKYTLPLVASHALTTGWDGAWSNHGESRIQRDSSSVGFPIANLDQDFDATVARIAVFGQDEWSITKQWSVYLGLRWEAIRTRSAGADYSAVENTSSVWSPLFQTLYKLPSKSDQLRLGLTRTYKAPVINQLIPRRFNAINNTATTPDQQGNPNLKPELAWGLDLAFEHTIEGGGLLSASTYLRRIDDNQRNNTALIDGTWLSMPVNTGTAQAHGIELEAKFPLRHFYKTAPAIDVRANLTRNWSSLDAVPGPNNRLVSQTPVSANVGVDYKAGKLPLTMGATYTFTNGGPVRFSAQQFDYSTPKRVLDMYALVKFSAKNQLRVSLANLLHQENGSATTYVDAHGALSDAVHTPTVTVFRAMLEMKL
ncbi:TonB-dependent receptor plug domain-containing protein [Massilia sp. S19_KUP03_FR1]|uniref:TonB-dependent receptor plug domain-containing protein n=1 Tax=Massilia sp. S19_KUP03_FR1 TaxID=3025503 RepID=UPI002FCD9809